jgi:hypothetical protein
MQPFYVNINTMIQMINKFLFIKTCFILQKTWLTRM